MLEDGPIDVEKYEHLKVRLLAKRQGTYTVYVFQNLDYENDGISKRYIMCTKCPNWNCDELDLYQEGFIKYHSVRAYVDTWVKQNTGERFYYKYSANYFIDFVPLTHVIDGNRVIENDKLLIS